MAVGARTSRLSPSNIHPLILACRVNMRLGSPQQWVSMFPSTVGQETWVIGSSGCDDSTSSSLISVPWLRGSDAINRTGVSDMLTSIKQLSRVYPKEEVSLSQTNLQRGILSVPIP
jgi:hypothetical protein